MVTVPVWQVAGGDTSLEQRRTSQGSKRTGESPREQEGSFQTLRQWGAEYL